MRSLSILALAYATLMSCPAFAETPAEFYVGKRLFLQIGSGPAGAYDVMGRLFARHMGKHIPGNPMIVAQNVPGGGSLVLANQFAMTTKADGTYFGVMNSGMPTSPLLNPDAVHFDPRNFSFLGSPNREVEILVVWKTAPVQTIDDLFKKELIVAASAPGSATYDIPLMTNALLGTKFKIVTGYQTAGATKIALERGEVEGNAALGLNTSKTQFGDVLESKSLLIIGQYGWERSDLLPDVPLIPLGKTEVDRQILDIAYARQDYGQPFVTPPNVPADRVAALRQAFVATTQDPDFPADAQRVAMDINPVSADELQTLTERLFATPPEVLERARSLMKKGR